MFLFIIYVGERLVPGWTPIIDKPLVDFSFSDWLWAFWDTAKIGNQGGLHSPMVLQFWFIRDLMVISLLSPIIYLALKPLTALREEIPAILLIALLIVSRWVNDVPGLSFQGLLFFSFGGYFSIRKKSFTDVMLPLKWVGLFFALFAWQFECMNLMYAGLIVFVSSVSTRVLKKWDTDNKSRPLFPAFLTRASFFIFACHTLFTGVFLYLFKTDIINPRNALEGLGIYLLCPLILLIIGALFHRLLQKISPKLTALLTGGR